MATEQLAYVTDLGVHGGVLRHAIRITGCEDGPAKEIAVLECKDKEAAKRLAEVCCDLLA